MADFTIDYDARGFEKELAAMVNRQIPFALSKGVNALALDVQAAERQQLRAAFTLRRAAWADMSVKITHFAKKTEPWATIAISPPGGGKADIFAKFEDETQKRPQAGHSLAIPVGARRNKSDIVTKGARPRALNLHEENGRIVGDRNTFLVRLPGGKGLILQRKKASRGRLRDGVRVGAREAGNVVLYFLAPRAQLTPNLRFTPTAVQVVERLWSTRMGEALSAALASAR